MVREYPSSNNNGKSSDSTNKIAQPEIQQRLERQAQYQEMIMSCWQPGYQLKNGRFIIVTTLGEGGFGVAYLARDQELKRNVVIKTLNQRVQSEPHFGRLKEDFKREAERLSQCRHSNIVVIYDCFDEGLLPCIVMDYIAGETLAKRLERGVLEEEEALHYIRQIGEALKAVHKKELVHRDVKPGNIVIREGTREAVLIDFGISREFYLTRYTAFFSEGYAPPEQYVESAPKDCYTDVYSLAATLYTLLTRTIPSSARDREYKINHDSRDSLLPPQDINERISYRVNKAIMKAMALKPIYRPQSVQEWLDLLKTPIQPSTPPTPNPPELTSFIAALTSSLNFLIALAIVSFLGTSLINTGFWLVLVTIFSSIYFLIFKGRDMSHLFYLVVISTIPTLVFFLFVPALRTWKIQNGGMVSLLLTVLASFLGFYLMNLYRDFSENK
jgi:serine/threonine protein kinase